MDWSALWNGTLDFLSVAAWPIVACVALFMFRKRIRDVTSINAGGLGLELEPPTLAGVEAEFSESVAPAFTPVLDEPPEPGAPTAPEARDPALPDSKADVEVVIRAAARAGYMVAATEQFKSIPEPEVEWTDEGPRIAYWKGTSEPAPATVTPADVATPPQPQRTLSALERIARLAPAKSAKQQLEDEIREQIKRQPSHMTESGQDSPLVRRLRMQLTHIDPNSPYAYKKP
ncbi:hypothetical protein CLV56_2833 [Mumia flava]|uniref:Uncharacterized protein n=1 Tax=Mumia flava TaxID=1348852 RepID=A0A2M9BKX1_9ACTN|nr:hypothetical protein [Mumia flava]PJJ58581.1 hypothetical protein CLV56_2833 [Mumia flava]